MKFFFWCEFESRGEPLWDVKGVCAESEPDARLLLAHQVKVGLPRLRLVKAEFLYRREDSLTEFIKKAA